MLKMLNIIKNKLTLIISSFKDIDLRIQLDHCLEEKNIIREKLRKAEQFEEIESNLIHEHNHYYKTADKDKAHPYCTNCWDTNKKLVLLHKGDRQEGVEYFDCPSCKAKTHIGEQTFGPISQNNFDHWGI